MKKVRQFSKHPVPAREASGAGGGGIPRNMTFISYAQNYEDVMLWRALKDVSNGFWIDIGAAHPREYSVTRAFSERGWCGVNVEPEPGYAAELRAERPRDVNYSKIFKGRINSSITCGFSR